MCLLHCIHGSPRVLRNVLYFPSKRSHPDHSPATDENTVTPSLLFPGTGLGAAPAHTSTIKESGHRYTNVADVEPSGSVAEVNCLTAHMQASCARLQRSSKADEGNGHLCPLHLPLRLCCSTTLVQSHTEFIPWAFFAQAFEHNYFTTLPQMLTYIRHTQHIYQLL
jgi:hypothetical protein